MAAKNPARENCNLIVGLRLRRARLRKKLTIRGLGRAIGVDYMTIWRAENAYGVHTYILFAVICHLGVSADSILPDREPQSENPLSHPSALTASPPRSGATAAGGMPVAQSCGGEP